MIAARGGLIKIAYAVLALVLAGVVALLSLEAPLRRTAPQTAMAVTPFDGLARTASVERQLRAATVEAGRGDVVPVSDAAAAEALQALAQEPSSALAVRQLGLHAAYTGQPARARGLIEAAHSLSRRDQIGLAWLITDAAKRAQLAPALGYIDAILRLDRDGDSAYLTLLAQALSQPGTADVGIKMMRANPPWLSDFLLEAAKLRTGLPNIVAIRTGLRAADKIALLDRDAALVGALQAAGDYGTAIRFVGWLAPERAPRSGGALRDGNFDRKPAYPPIDWQLAGEADYGAEIAGGHLVVSAVADAGGVVARQIADLAPGRYRLDVVRTIGTTGPAPMVEVACVTRPSIVPARVEAARAGSAASFAVTSACRYFLVSVTARRQADDGYDIELDRIAIVPLANG